MLIWAASSVAAWLTLQLLSVKWCTGWRGDKTGYGFLVLLLLLWYVPDVLLGSSGAKAVEQVLFYLGFPVSAIYAGGLLVAEFADRRRQKNSES